MQEELGTEAVDSDMLMIYIKGDQNKDNLVDKATTATLEDSCTGKRLESLTTRPPILQRSWADALGLAQTAPTCSPARLRDRRRSLDFMNQYLIPWYRF